MGFLMEKKVFFLFEIDYNLAVSLFFFLPLFNGRRKMSLKMR